LTFGVEEDKIISKEKAIEFLTENVFFSRPSREISKVFYENIVEYNLVRKGN